MGGRGVPFKDISLQKSTLHIKTVNNLLKITAVILNGLFMITIQLSRPPDHSH